MDSSDSEDDCYGNIAQKLQRMKNKYTEDKIESTNLLNESSEVEEILEKADKTSKLPVKSSPERKKSVDSVDNDDIDSISLEAILAMSSKRVTRSSSKRSSTEVSINENSRSTRPNKRKKSSHPAANGSSTVTDLNCSSGSENTSRNSSQSRGRARSRGRGRNRRMNAPAAPNYYSNIPTYSVGNTDEYPDQSNNQQLFSSTKASDDVMIVEENEVLDENEELSVKVYWQSSEYFKFNIRRFQKLSQIFEYFAKKENVNNDKLFFTFNDRILKPDDTPDSIKYSIVKFIDGGIVNRSVSQLIQSNGKDDVNGIKVKFQCQNVKKPFETSVGLDEKLSLAMMKCAEHFETAIDKLKFEFDGDSISGKVTARELELEGGECIDVKIIR